MNWVRTSLCGRELEKRLNAGSSGSIKSATSWSGFRFGRLPGLALISGFCWKIGFLRSLRWHRSPVPLNAWFTNLRGGCSRVPWATAERGRPVCKLHGLPKRIYGDAFVHKSQAVSGSKLYGRMLVCRDRHPLRGYRPGVDAGHRAALARGFVASARAGECEEKTEILDKHRTLRLAPEPHTLDL